MGKCAIEGCLKEIDHLDKCRAHYLQEWRRRPDVKGRIKKQCFERFRKPKSRFNNAKHTAKKRGHIWSISFKQYEKILKEKCFYCQQPMPISTGSGLDRKDCSKGYTLANCVPSCWECNWIKHDHFSVEETQVMVRALIEFRCSR